LPPLVFAALRLAQIYHSRQQQDELWNKKVSKLFQFAHGTIKGLIKSHSSQYEAALRLFLQCVTIADRLQFETYAYEFMTSAMLVYEREILNSRAQMDAIVLIIATLQKTCNFSESNYDTLGTKVAVYSSKLLTKPDQCRGVCMSTHLFWSGKTQESEGKELRDGKRVLECLQKSIRIADACMGMDSTVNVHLFVEILNHYIYYYEHNNQSIQTKYLTGLIDLIQTNLANTEAGDNLEHIHRHFQNTLAHIKQCKENPVDGQPSFAELTV